MENVTQLGSEEPGSEICIFVLKFYSNLRHIESVTCFVYSLENSVRGYRIGYLEKKPNSHFYVPMSTIIILQFPCVRCQSTWGVKFPICWSHKFTTECDCILSSPPLAPLSFCVTCISTYLIFLLKKSYSFHECVFIC